jgi:hypothetical protein
VVRGFKLDPAVRGKWGRVVGLALLCTPYGYGLATELNAVLDHSPPATYSVHVTEKHVSRGRRSNCYKLRLEPWGARLDGKTVFVPRALYRATQVGDIVCLDLKPGALRLAWYVVRSCR